MSISNIQAKLDAQIKRREFYQEQHEKIMDILNIPKANRHINMILPAVMQMKKSLNSIEAQNEGNLLLVK